MTIKPYVTDEQTKGFMLGLPSGKSLEDATIDLLRIAHISVTRAHQRMCLADIEGLPGFWRAVFVKPSQLPALVAERSLVAALTGRDTVLESNADVTICASFSYSRATSAGTRCVLFHRGQNREGDEAVSDFWPLDLGGREVTTPPVQVISEYPKETIAFFNAKGFRADVVPCTGSAEALVTMGRYDYGVALVETGTSLRVNGLGIVATIFESETVLIANTEKYKDPRVKDHIDYLAQLLAGVLGSRDKRFITMNAPVARVDDIRRFLPTLKSPTVQPLADGGYCAISSVVPVKGINDLKRLLLSLGAEGIVEFDHDSIV